MYIPTAQRIPLHTFWESLWQRSSNASQRTILPDFPLQSFYQGQGYSTVVPTWGLHECPSIALCKKMKSLIAFWCILVRFSIKRKRWYVHTICQEKKKWRKCWQFHYTLVMRWSELTYYKIKNNYSRYY